MLSGKVPKPEPAAVPAPGASKRGEELDPMRVMLKLAIGLVALTNAQTTLQAADAPMGLQEYLRSEMRELQIPGMQVAVVQHQKIVLLVAFGFADIENQLPVTDATVFPIASATKA